jgi:hypothetical protein
MILRVYDSVSADREESEREKIEKRLIRVQSGVQDEKKKPEGPEE